MKRKLTQKALTDILGYSPETGEFWWLFGRHNSIRGGEKAGYIDSHGYWLIKINRIAYKAHIIAWVIMTGEWPLSEVDHVDRIRCNNIWKNLRLADKTQQRINRSVRYDSKTGYKGVQYRSGKRKKHYVAYLGGDNGRTIIGYFETAEEASIAYKIAEKEKHGEFAAS